ncbi:MAG: S8 family peptidase [Acidobacteriales bacterium]|nr:S8 family peptidase [Terriglobales bacterium]
MAREHNFLFGFGERLARPVEVPSGGGDKNPPYAFERAKKRLCKKLASSIAEFDQIPESASPNGEVVARLTMHPRYISKSDFPTELLDSIGLRPIGSRSAKIKPDAWGIKKPPDEAITEELFVAGSRHAFSSWANGLAGWTEATRGAKDIVHIESIEPFRARDKLRSIPKDRETAVFEVVLHNVGDERIIQAFVAYVGSLGEVPIVQRRRDIKGLTFIPVKSRSARVEDIARFSFVRVARGMPTLRPMTPGLLRAVSAFRLQFPTVGPLDSSIRAAVFDGGLSTGARMALQPWVTLVEPIGIGKPDPSYEEHGTWVTSALLFGPLVKGKTAPQPICPVDHIRVLDANTGEKNDLECIDVLDRILGTLDENPGKYQFINISLGPRLAVTDDEVTQWTAALDERLSEGRVVATVAAGNDGDLDDLAGLNRIQPPADGVNVLAVGASDSQSADWKRAEYSCVGPGRSPGVVKPDGVAFGGSDDEPFMVPVSKDCSRAEGTQGTSFASPLVLRSALSVHAQLGYSIRPLAIRALLIHRATDGTQGRKAVGWGRFDTHPQRLITCDDDEALVVFQGDLPVGEHLRVPVPVPRSPLKGSVILSATLVIAPQVDPEHPGAYTRSGLEVSFRPHAERYKEYPNGTSSKHPQTKSFFSGANMYGAGEYLMREGGQKWEPCLRNSQTFRATSLLQPCFDIYYHHRQGGGKAVGPLPIQYALVVSLKAPMVPDLYNQVVRAYTSILVPLQPRLRIQLM